ncbi:MAG: ADP-glyceromanno-heptose 6-epimerase [Ginsengibacter sp.]
MNESLTIVVTGAAGFIGSCLVGLLNHNGYNNLILVDDFSKHEKDANLANKKFSQKVDREEFFEWIKKIDQPVDFFYHIGARTDTTEFDYAIHEHLNLAYSKKVWKYCTEKNIPLVYASSAATYGAGELGYKDDESIIKDLKPLNPYGVSKNEFDKWALQQTSAPPAFAGLKFFNVYGPNEYHKGRMASVIFHSFKQIIEHGFVKLFKSHKDGFKDGEQLRDFIYVKDVLNICYWFLESSRQVPSSFISGIYNVGTGKARTFNDLVKSTFNAMDLETQIEYIDMPEDIRNTYQYFTEADMHKIKDAGYNAPFYSLEEGVDDYIRNYMLHSVTY